MLDELFLYRAKFLYSGSRIHKVVDMQRFLRSNYHGWLQREIFNLFLLICEGAVIHLKKLCIDSCDGRIILTAVIDHEEDPSLHGVVLL